MSQRPVLGTNLVPRKCPLVCKDTHLHSCFFLRRAWHIQTQPLEGVLPLLLAPQGHPDGDWGQWLRNSSLRLELRPVGGSGHTHQKVGFGFSHPPVGLEADETRVGEGLSARLSCHQVVYALGRQSPAEGAGKWTRKPGVGSHLVVWRSPGGLEGTCMQSRTSLMLGPASPHREPSVRERGQVGPSSSGSGHQGHQGHQLSSKACFPRSRG